MNIETLNLWNFRNYETLSLKFENGINILSGKNGQGKTNIIEAVYLLCTGKSHRTSREKDMIMNGREWMRVNLENRQRDGIHKIDMLLPRNDKKRILINGLAISRISEILGQVSGVIFSPEDLFLVKQGPSERRRFIDIELSQVNKNYFYALNEYNKVLDQRNALLKELTPKNKTTLDVWDSMLAQRAVPIITARREFCKRLAPLAQKNHEYLSDGKEKLFCEYKGCCESDDIEGELCNALNKGRDADLRRMYTNIGPHKDDISIKLAETDLRYFGSQGQQRTATLALKLTELEIMKQDIGEYPVLLLDDVLSELDETRQKRLLERIDGVQTIITTAQPIDFMFSGKKTAVFNIINGRVGKS